MGQDLLKSVLGKLPSVLVATCADCAFWNSSVQNGARLAQADVRKAVLDSSATGDDLAFRDTWPASAQTKSDRRVERCPGCGGSPARFRTNLGHHWLDSLRLLLEDVF